MDTSEIVIERVAKFSSEIVDAVRRLIKQEGEHYQSLTDNDVQEMIQNPHGYLFIARHVPTQEIAGMIFVAIYRIPYVKKAYIDDIVVDEKFRKRGIATKLLQIAVEEAKKQHVSYVMLTARTTRVANKLYEKLGFQKRESHAYRLYI
jgi:ribosomal protein S18 acetylase RimI-like enzyme